MTTNVDGEAQAVAASREAPADGYLFDVFLSYSRKDEEFGKRLEEALENFRLPKGVKADSISTNRLRVFRDKNDLVPTEGDYYKTIEGYLKRSAYLVIVCSPNARKSRYVDKEVEVFLQVNEAKRIIPVLLSGKPNNESADSPEESAFPETLCRALEMPLALPFTEFTQRGGRLSGARYRDSWYTLLAKIFGAERAEIERVDARRRARRRMILAAVSVAVIAALSVALVFALVARREAETQRAEAVRQRDQARRLLYASDVSLAQRAYETGNVQMGQRLLGAHLPDGQPGGEDLRGFEWYYLWRLYNGQLRTFEGTDDVAFSRDGARFATVTKDELKVWDAAALGETATVKLSRRKAADGSGVEDFSYAAIDFSPDGRTVAYGAPAGKTLLLDTGSGSPREVPAPVLGERQMQMFTQENFPEVVERLGGGDALRFSPDGKLLAVSYDCGIVVVYDALSLQQVAALGDGPIYETTCASFVTFSPDGRVLAYGNQGGLSLWDTVARRDLAGPGQDPERADSGAMVEAAAFSPDGKLVAVGDRSKQIVFWNVSTGKVLARLRGHAGWVTALAFSPDGKTLYSGGDDHVVRLWDFGSYKGDGRVAAEQVRPFAALKGHAEVIRSIRCSPAGGVLATLGGDGTVRLWNGAAGREFDSAEGVDVVFGGTNLFGRFTDYSVALFDGRGGAPAELWRAETDNVILSPDGKTLAVQARDAGADVVAGTVKLLDVNSRDELATLRVRLYDSSGAFTPDGRLFSAVTPDRKGVVLWDVAAGRELPTVTGDAELESYLLSGDGKVLVTLDKEGGRVRAWDVASRQQTAVFERGGRGGAGEPDSYVASLLPALSSDGKLLAFSVLESKEVKLWETGGAREPVTLGRFEEAEVTDLKFSPGGRLLATCDEAGVVKLWDVSARRELSAFRGHRGKAAALAFSPDGRTLASGGDDGVVKLYGTASARELLTFTHEPSPASDEVSYDRQGSEDAVTQLFFTADGRSLVTLSLNKVLRIWRGADRAGVPDRAR